MKYNSAILILVIIIASCNLNPKDQVYNINIIQSSGSAYSTVSLIAEIEYDGNKPTVIWSTSDEAIATVNEQGLVSPVIGGSVIITATVGNISDSINLIFNDIRLIGEWERYDSSGPGTESYIFNNDGSYLYKYTYIPSNPEYDTTSSGTWTTTYSDSLEVTIKWGTGGSVTANINSTTLDIGSVFTKK